MHSCEYNKLLNLAQSIGQVGVYQKIYFPLVYYTSIHCTSTTIFTRSSVGAILLNLCSDDFKNWNVLF